MSTAPSAAPLPARRARAALLGGLAAVVAANAPLLSRAYTIPWDATDSWLLALRWMGSCLRAGHFPDYFPHVFSGYAIGAQPELGCYNPLYLLVAVLFPDSVRSVNVLALVLQCLQFGLGFRLARQLGLGPLGAFCFGLSLVASGFWVGNAEHISFQASAVSATLVFCGLLDLGGGKARAGFVLVALGCYLLGSAGYPALMLTVPLVAGLLALDEMRRAARPLKMFALATGAAAAGGLLALPTLVHFVSALARNHRGHGVDVATVLRGSLPLYSLANVFWPGWRWTVSATDLSMDRFHLLCLTPWAALALLWLRWRRSHRLPPALAARLPLWGGLAVFFLVLSLGKNFPVPVRAFLADHFLVFRMGRWPGVEYIFFVQLVLALLGAAGVEALAARGRRAPALLAALVAADFMVVMVATRDLRFRPTPPPVAGTLPLFKVAFDEGERALLERPRLCPDPSRWMIEQWRLAPSRFSWWGYMALVPDVYVRDLESVRWALCPGPRLWDADEKRPIPYTLLVYSPGRVSIRFSVPERGIRVLWAETADPYWRLLVAGRPQPFDEGPAALRYFRVPPGVTGEVQADMIYRGPLSGLWRRTRPLPGAAPAP